MKHIAHRRLFAVQGSHVCIQATDNLDFAVDGGETLAKETVFSSTNATMIVTSIILHITDICSSTTVCYYLFLEKKLWWFLLMVIPLVASLMVVNSFSLKWYWHDRRESKLFSKEVSKAHWVLRIFLHVSFLGPVIRYLEMYAYGLHSLDSADPNREIYEVLLLQEERDISFLALVGSFIKSAPQLVLAIYILLQNKRMIQKSAAHAQEVSAVVSVACLSLALTSYHRALRRSNSSKLNMTNVGSGMQFISHFLIIGSRVLTLAAFASVYRHWLFPFLLLHWYIMMMWLVYKKTNFCSKGNEERRTCEEISFNAVMAVIYVFCFMNVKDEPTRYKYAFYYALVWIENVTLAVLWYIKATSDIWLKTSILISVFLGLSTGLFVLAVYYNNFHPNKNSKVTTFIKAPVPVDDMNNDEVQRFVQ